MKTIIIALVALAVGIGAGAMMWGSSGSSSPATQTDATQQKYTCGMHPEIISDEPGYCPICEMKLTPLKDGSGTKRDGSVLIDPVTSQNMGLVTSAVAQGSVSRSVRAFGEVTPAEPRVSSVTVKFEGWVERLFLDYEGAEVYKGEPLLEIYSPRLVAAQEEYLIALREPGMAGLLTAAEKRLRNFDISDDQIAHLRSSGETKRTLTIRAPKSGVVLSKMVEVGDKVKPGMSLYRIADLSTVWLTASVYEQDLPFVAEGQSARITVPGLAGRSFEGTISYVAPFLNAGRQAEVRVVLANPDGALKPDMYAEMSLVSESDSDRLLIPRRAVINSGTRQVVYIETDSNRYEPRVVQLGAIGDNDMAVVTDGLALGERVIVSGQFLLDSESRLHEALAMPAMVHGDQDQTHATHNAVAHLNESPDTTAASGIYTCPMPSHFHVLQYGEGNCSECGMKLVPIEDTENTNVYACPMRECNEIKQEPGRCSVCGMKLLPVYPASPADSVTRDKHYHGDMTHDAEKKPAELSGIYTCPMPSHFHVLQYGEGICAECDMKLVPIEDTENANVYACPMRECAFVQKGPGKCAVCGMPIQKVEQEPGRDQ